MRPIPFVMNCLSYRHGVCSRRILARVCGLSSKCKSSKEDYQPCKPGAKPCEPPPNPDKPIPCRKQVEPVANECQQRKMNIQKGCMPWDRAAELCPTKKPQQLDLELPVCCEHVGLQQNILKIKKMSTCQRRLYDKCLNDTSDPKMCLKRKPEYGLVKKEYPMATAVRKGSIPGSPAPGWQRISKPTYPDCEE